MAKKASFEIYEGLDQRKKKYVVVKDARKNKKLFEESVSYLAKLNHCSKKHIKYKTGYIIDDLLYLEGKPCNDKAQFVTVLYYVR